MAEPRERELQRTRSHPIEDYISLRCPSIPRVLETNERVTGHAALEMVTASRLMSAHSSESVKVLDNASGAGILPSVIRQLQKEEAIRANVSIVAADKDPMYIAQLQERQKANQEQWADIGIKQFDMQKPPFSDNEFDIVYANMGIFFCPDDEGAMRETLRILKPGGQSGFTSWAKISWYPMAEFALAEYLPSAPPLPKIEQLFPSGYDQPSVIKDKLTRAGFTDVSVHEHAFAPLIEPEPFAEATGQLCEIAMKRFWSKEDQDQYAGQAEKAILQYLNKQYKDGVWDGKMKALVSFASKAWKD